MEAHGGCAQGGCFETGKTKEQAGRRDDLNLLARGVVKEPSSISSLKRVSKTIMMRSPLRDMGVVKRDMGVAYPLGCGDIGFAISSKINA
jgi:hypothetical protein